MTDPRIVKLADILVNYSVAVQPDDKVVLLGALETRPLRVEIYRKIIREGGHPLVFWNESSVHWDMICDMRDGGKIWVDDELFYDSGEFVID